MNISDYKTIKALDIANKTENVKVLLINGSPALQIKKYNEDTGALLSNVVEVGVDVPALKKQIDALRLQIDNINELIKDAEALNK